MSTENLKFVIEGDVSGGLSGIDKVINAIDKLTASLQKSNISKSVSQLDQKLGILGKQKVDLTKLIIARDFAPDIAGVRELTNSIELAKKTIKDLTTVQKDAPQLGIIGRIREEISGIKNELNFQQSESSIISLNQRLVELQAELKRVSSLGTEMSAPQLGIIGNLKNEISAIKNDLNFQQSESSIVSLNQRLEELQNELKRVSALGLDAKNSIEEIAKPIGILQGQKNKLSELFQLRDAATTSTELEKINNEIQATQKSISNLSSAGIKLDQSLGLIGKRSEQLIELRNSLPNLTSISEIRQTTTQIERLENEIRVLSRAGRSVPDISPGMNKLKRSSGAANFAILSLTQGVQDLPFGFIAIQNNIEQLFTSFTLLKTETGSFKSAISAMGAALTGPAGLGLAFSAVISAITFFSLRNRGAKKDVDELQQTIDNIRKSLLGDSDAFEKAQNNTAKQEAALKLLYDTSTDVNKSYQERISAAQKLQQLFPKTFSNISQEKIISGQAASAYKFLADNILKVAQAEANLQTIIENDKTKNKIQKQLTDLSPEYQRLSENVDKAREAFNKAVKISGVTGADAPILSYQKSLNQAIKARDEFAAKLNDLAGSYKKADDENNRLSKDTNTLNLSLKQLGDTSNDTSAKTETISDIIKRLQDDFATIDQKAKIYGLTIQQIGALKMEALSQAIEDVAKIHTPAAIEKGKEWLAQLHEIANSLPKTNLGPTPTPNFPGVQQAQTPDYINPVAPQLPEDTQRLNTEKNKILSDQLREQVRAARQLEGVFEDIFSTLSNGGNVFQSLIKSIEQLIIKLAAAAAAAEILSIITGGTSAGFGAIFGQLSGLKGLTSFASGGFIPTPQLAVVGDAPGGEWVLNQRQMSALLNGVGGRQKVDVTVTGRLSGRDIQLANIRTNKNENLTR